MAAVAEEPAAFTAIPIISAITLSRGMVAGVSGVSAMAAMAQTASPIQIRYQALGERLVSSTGPIANFQVMGRP